MQKKVRKKQRTHASYVKFLKKITMENTLENKAKFFAQYWEQEVYKHITWINTSLKNVLNGQRFLHIENAYLELKPLSSVIDEDVIFCTELMGVSLNSDIDYYRKMLIEGFVNKEFYGTFYPYRVIEIIDYLRSKGYALPWMGLSVETMIEFGWIKLKNTDL